MGCVHTAQTPFGFSEVIGPGSTCFGCTTIFFFPCDADLAELGDYGDENATELSDKISYP